MSTLLRARWIFGLLGLGLACAVSAAGLQPTDDPAASAIWQKVKASVFEGRTIAPAPPGLLTLDAPSRAVDAAVVPIAIRARLPAGDKHYVRKLYLIIDANPSPVSAIFDLSAESGRAEVETRVRVDDYSHVRAIAETSDGRLFMTTRFTKASGGCSAPAGADAAAAQASLGKLLIRTDGNPTGSEPMLAQLSIAHPNHSGMAMDQYTRQFTPAHYVRRVDVSYRGQPVFSADVDFSMSENPNFRFYFLPHGGGEMKATVVDSNGLTFTATQMVGEAAK